MNELHFANRIRQHLSRGAHDLPPEVLDRLAAARTQALAHQKIAAHQSVLATAGNFVQFQLESPRFRQILAAMALLLGLAFTASWQADQRIQELQAIDSALLSDDLPIGAYTDKGFDAWLKRDLRD